MVVSYDIVYNCDRVVCKKRKYLPVTRMMVSLPLKSVMCCEEREEEEKKNKKINT